MLVASGFAMSCLWQRNDHTQMLQKVKELCNCELPGWWISDARCSCAVQEEPTWAKGCCWQGWGIVGIVLRSLPRHCPKDGCRSLGRCKRCSFLITRPCKLTAPALINDLLYSPCVWGSHGSWKSVLIFGWFLSSQLIWMVFFKWHWNESPLTYFFTSEPSLNWWQPGTREMLQHQKTHIYFALVYGKSVSTHLWKLLEIDIFRLSYLWNFKLSLENLYACWRSPM